MNSVILPPSTSNKSIDDLICFNTSSLLNQTSHGLFRRLTTVLGTNDWRPRTTPAAVKPLILVQHCPIRILLQVQYHAEPCSLRQFNAGFLSSSSLHSTTCYPARTSQPPGRDVNRFPHAPGRAHDGAVSRTQANRGMMALLSQNLEVFILASCITSASRAPSLHFSYGLLHSSTCGDGLGVMSPLACAGVCLLAW